MGPDFFSHQRISQVHTDPLEKQLDLLDPIVSRGVSVPLFLTKPITTCDFPGGGGGGGGVWCPHTTHTLDLTMQCHDNIYAHLFVKMKKLLTGTQRIKTNISPIRKDETISVCLDMIIFKVAA